MFSEILRSFWRNVGRDGGLFSPAVNRVKSKETYTPEVRNGFTFSKIAFSSIPSGNVEISGKYISTFVVTPSMLKFDGYQFVFDVPFIAEDVNIVNNSDTDFFLFYYDTTYF